MSATHLTDVIHLPRRQPCETSGCSDPKCLGLTPDRRLTLAVIARNANREGVTWSVGTTGVAERRGIDQSTASRQLKWLAGHKLIAPQGRRSRDGSISYVVTFRRPARRTTFDVAGWWFDHLLSLGLVAGDTVALLACAVYANKATKVFTPSVRTLAALAGEEERNFQRRLSRLVADGHLHREVQGFEGRLGTTPVQRRVNRWTLSALTGVEQPVVAAKALGTSTAPKHDARTTPGSRGNASRTTQNLHSNLSPSIHQPKPAAEPEPKPAEVVDLTAAQKRATANEALVDGLSKLDGEWGALMARIRSDLVPRLTNELAFKGCNVGTLLEVARKLTRLNDRDPDCQPFVASKITNPGGFLTTLLRKVFAIAREGGWVEHERAMARDRHRKRIEDQYALEVRNVEGYYRDDLMMAQRCEREDWRADRLARAEDDRAKGLAKAEAVRRDSLWRLENPQAVAA